MCNAIPGRRVEGVRSFEGSTIIDEVKVKFLGEEGLEVEAWSGKGVHSRYYK